MLGVVQCATSAILPERDVLDVDRPDRRPRIGNVRTIDRSAIADSMSARVAVGNRSAIDQSAPG